MRGERSPARRAALAPALLALVLWTPALMARAGDAAAIKGAPPAEAAVAPKKAARPAPVDINSASKAQLKTLPGIGDAEAARIIAGRPYLSKADLSSKKTLPLGVYMQIKNRIVAVQRPPKAKAGK